MPQLFDPAEKNLFGYLSRALDTFEARPLADVDSLVLACLSYFRYQGDAVRASGGAPLRDLFRTEWVEAMTHGLWDPEGLSRLLALVAASPRFRDVRVSDYVDDFDEAVEKQFSACVLRLPGGGAYLSFRGTDNTLVGWKEDFNMAFQSPVPAQVSAAEYLEEVAHALPGALYAGGHSKGGNLAVYAAIMCPHALQDRIVRVFSHDGPGFNEQFLRGKGFARMRGRIDKTLPRSSMFGMIFEDQEDYAIVDSTSFALLQHNPFSWVVDGTDFKRVERISAGARYLDKTLSDWMARIPPEERGRVIDAVFDVIGATDATYFAEIRDSWQESLPKMRAAAGEVPAETRDLFKRLIKALVRTATIGQVADTAGRAADAAGRLVESATQAAGKMASRLQGGSSPQAVSEDGGDAESDCGGLVDIDAFDRLSKLIAELRERYPSA